MTSSAQHDQAEYVPAETLEAWKQRDPLARYEKYLTENNLWDTAVKRDIAEGYVSPDAAKRDYGYED